MKGTGFSPYIAEAKQWALATEGSVFGRETCPRGLKADWLSIYMYGLKAVPFSKATFSAACSAPGDDKPIRYEGKNPTQDENNHPSRFVSPYPEGAADRAGA
jgi:hypothetical protein